MELAKGKYLEYKDRPLVREGDTICYGDKNEKCYLCLDILSYKEDEVTGEKIPDKIYIQIIDSKDPQNFLKTGEKSSLYEAFTLGLIWLERELNVNLTKPN